MAELQEHVERAMAATPKLDQRVAIITGAAQGIGSAFARRFAQAGATVVVADRQEEAAVGLAERLNQRRSQALAVTVDISDRDSTLALVQETVERFGRVDILINNAAIFSTIEMKPFEQLAVEEWRRVLDVNLTGAFLCCQAVVPVMRAGGCGRIINISSATVLLGRPFYAHYVSAKAGLIGLTRALARELGPDHITVNAIMPGSTETEIPRETVDARQAETLIAAQSIHRRGRPEDLVGAAAFLASDDAGFMTGQTLVVDGGLNFV